MHFPHNFCGLCFNLSSSLTFSVSSSVSFLNLLDSLDSSFMSNLFSTTSLYTATSFDETSPCVIYRRTWDIEHFSFNCQAYVSQERFSVLACRMFPKLILKHNLHLRLSSTCLKIQSYNIKILVSIFSGICLMQGQEGWMNIFLVLCPSKFIKHCIYNATKLS